ncbi:hypothetical protein ACFTZM_11355 [Streptomyces hydrogenans]|uniref:hypothetical protein n=1 Tax=Streptomyces hydrogenans TaxID=1873719 RepID=UPI003635D0AC
MTMLTTPARNAMEGHGLTNATLVLDAQNTAIAYAVLSPATGRYSVLTLDGRWVIPSAEGYKSRGPVTTYARKAAEELRPEGLRVYEPVRHVARPQVGRYGARRQGMCMGPVQFGGVGYECGSCRAYVSLDSVWREGFTIVRDGRGTHTLSYALDKSHARTFGEGVQHRVTSPEGEKAIAALQVELETIRHETASIKSLAAEAETHAAVADAAKDAALDSRNVVQAYAAVMAAVAAAREIALLVKLAVRRCEALDKLRDAFRTLAESVGVESYTADADRLYEDAKGYVDSAWEYCGVVEESERTATAAAVAAEAEYGHRCLKCGAFFRQPTSSGGAPRVPCACSALYAGSEADVTDPGTIPAPWECAGQLELAEENQEDVVTSDNVPQESPADAPQEVPPWIANITLPALTVTDRTWWIGRYGQWTTKALGTRGTPRAVLKFARAAESAGWAVAVRAGNDSVDDETMVGVWEVEATGRCHDNASGGQRDAVLSVMWIQKRDGGRWTFDRDRSVAEIGDRVLSGIQTLADYEKNMRLGRPARVGAVTEAAPVSAPAPIAAQPDTGAAASTVEPVKSVAAETVPAPAVSGPRVVPLVESVRRARDEQHAASVRAWDAQTSVKDLDDARKEAVNLGLSVDQEERLRETRARAAAAASDADSTAFRARVAADALERSRVGSAADMVQMRERTARLFAGEGDDRPRWVSSDGRTVIVSAPSPEWDVDGTAERFAELLAGAVAAKDAGRMLKSTDVPTKSKHGRGGTTELRQAVARSVRPLLQPWKAPRVPAEGKPLDGASLAALDADGVCAETEAAPGVWVPQAAVHVADAAVANGWTVSMERDTRGDVTVRVAGIIVRESGRTEGEIVAIWTSGMYDAARSYRQAGARRLDAQLKRVLTTIGHPAEPGTITTAPAPVQTSAPAPHGVSDPSGVDTWETDGGHHPAPRPVAPAVERWTIPASADPSIKNGTCTGTGSVDVETRADTVSAPGTVDDWEAEGGAVPGVAPLDIRPAPQAPAGPWEPKGERWDFRMVRDVLTRHGFPEGDLGVTDGWMIGPNMWDVMITRTQGSDIFRPRGRARDAWDDAMRAYGTAMETETGMTVVRRNAHCIVVNVDVPAGLRVTARARRVGPLDDFTTTVTFDGYDGIGGTVTLRSAGVGASFFEVRDHTGHTVTTERTNRRAATASLAHWYGLPTPVEYVEKGPEPAPANVVAPRADAPQGHLPDVTSDPGTVDAWNGDGGATPGVTLPQAPPAPQSSDTDPYQADPAAIMWTAAPGSDRRTGELNIDGVQYRIHHAPAAVLPYTVRRTVDRADIDLGGWVDLDDACAIVRADRRRTAALRADRLHTERQQRRAAHRMQGERRQVTVRPSAEERHALARRTEQHHRPAAAELYVSPITGAASVAFVCGTCRIAHDDREGRPQSLGAGYTTPRSVDPDALAALLTKRGWNVAGPWTSYGTRGDTLRALITPTPAYLAWRAASHGPAPQAPAAAPGERITPVARGWWEVVSAEGHRYELTWRPALTGPVWRVRHQCDPTGTGTAVARTEQASTAMAELRSHSASLAQEPAVPAHESVHVPIGV